jgi:hypothetical protein
VSRTRKRNEEQVCPDGRSSVGRTDILPCDDATGKHVSTGMGAYATGGSLVAKTDLPLGAIVCDVNVRRV